MLLTRFAISSRQESSLKVSSREIHKHIRGRGYIGNAALGISDGLVTNLALLSGFAGATSNLQLIRFAGAAAMLAGGISMFFSGILAGRSEYELFEADVKREAGEIEQEPEEEKNELKSFYLAKGLSREETEMVVARIASNKEKFLEDILIHELHEHKTKLESPFKMGGVIGLSFLVGAVIPLAPFVFLSTRDESIILAALVSPLFLFLIGGWKGRIVGRRFWKSGLETLLIGAVASGVLYLVGTAFGFF